MRGTALPRLCANLKCLFTERPFLERFDAAARAGFTAVEYASPYEYSAKDLRSRLNTSGLQQILFNTPAGDPAEASHDVATAVYVANLAWAAEAAAGTGVKLVLEAINQRDVPGFYLRTQ